MTLYADIHKRSEHCRLYSRAARCFLFLALIIISRYGLSTEQVRVGLLKFGTVNWELTSMIANDLDSANGVAAKVVTYASGDATKIALQGGEVDVIVSDWLWVSRQRTSGLDLTFVPYSSSVGAIMVPGDSHMQNLGDLKNKKIGVAGGPLDKNWLLLQAMARQNYQFGLAAENEIVFGAPPLLAEKTRAGELDAMLNFWHYCARLEALGFKRLVSGADAAAALGATGAVSSIGYVFSEKWAADHPTAVQGFIAASSATKTLLANSDEEWVRLAESGVIKDRAVARNTLRDRFREGIPDRQLSDEVSDASRLYAILSELGGSKLVGPSPAMADGTYWSL